MNSMSEYSFGGSQAFNRISSAIEDVIPNSGSLLLNIPIVNLVGINDGIGLTINLCYSLGSSGALGLPANWGFDIPSLVPGRSLGVNGARYIIDPSWMDATGYASGLKYENNHGISFVDNIVSQPLPYGQYGAQYEFTYTDNDGSVCFFDSTGALLMKADRHGNYIYYAYAPGQHGNVLDYIVDSFGQKTTFAYSAGQIIVTLPDARTIAINCDGTAVYSMTDPAGNTTSFTNIKQGNFTVVSAIAYPTGKTTNVAYTSIGFLDSSGATYSIPAVSDLYFVDPDGNLLSHYQYAYGTQSGGNTFTGLQGGYKLSSDADGLLDSNNAAYIYNVEVRALDQAGTILSLTDIFYSFAHVPTTKNTYVIDATGSQGGYLQENSVYDISQDSHNQQPNYLSPKQTQLLFFPAPSAPGVAHTQTSFQYDNFGNTTSKQTSTYDAASGKYVASLTEAASYFTQGAPITTLVDTATKTDHIANQALRTVNTLTPDSRSVASSTMEYSDDGGATWTGWKARKQTFDAAGREISEVLEWVAAAAPGVQQTGSTFAYTYDAAAFTVATTVTDALLFATVHTISTMNGQKVSETSASGKTTSYAYDRIGRLVSRTSPSGRQTTYAYKLYASGGENSTTKTNALGYQTKDVSNPLGQRIATYDNGTPGKPQQLRLLSRVQYDALGNVIAEADVFGNTTTGAYNSLGKPTLSVDPLGNRTNLTYDLAANSTTTLINGITLKRVVTDDLGRPVLEEKYPNTTNADKASQYTLSRTSEYDGFGNLTSRTSSQIQAGISTVLHTRAYRYNAEAQTISDTFSAPDGSMRVTQTVYDLNKKKISHAKTVTYPDGRTYSVPSDVCEHDALGQMVKLTNSAGQVESYTYDGDRHLASKTLFDGSAITYAYTDDGKKSEESWREGGVVHTTAYTYDHAGHLLSTGDASGAVTNSYSLDGVLTSITTPDGKTLTYTLDEYSRKASQVDVAGATTTYTYTAQNQLLGVTNAKDSLTYGYYADTSVNSMLGAPKSVTLANNYTETYRYDAHGIKNGTDRVSVAGAILLSESSTFNALKKRISSISSSALTNSTTVNFQRVFSYDAFGQVVTDTLESSSGQLLGSETFEYDGNGNVLKTTGPATGTSTAYTYNSIDQLTAFATDGGQPKTQKYDVNGRLVIDGSGNSYAYDVPGKLLSVQGATGATRYTYYPNDLLATRTSSTSSVGMYYDNLQQVVNSTQNGALTQFLMMGSKRFVSYCGNAAPYCYGTNQRQDTVFGCRAASGGSESFVGSTAYAAYGSQTDRAIGMDASDNFAWNQEYTDVDSGLVYLRARFYDPGTLRFISRDSKRLDNRYSYCNGDPVNNVDPAGRDLTTNIEIGVGVGVAVAAAGLYLAITYGTAAVAVATAVTAAAGGIGVVTSIAAGALVGAGALALGAGAGTAGVIAGGVAIASSVAVATVTEVGVGAAVGAAIGTTLGAYVGGTLGGAGAVFAGAAAGGLVGGVVGSAASTAAGYVGSAAGAAAGYLGSAAGTAGAAAVETVASATEAASAAISAAASMAGDAAAAAAAAVGLEGLAEAAPLLLLLLL